MKKKSQLSEFILIGIRFIIGLFLLLYSFVLAVVLIGVYAFKDEKVNSNKHLNNVLTNLKTVVGIK